MSSHPLNHPLLPIWLGLIARCHVPSHPSYRHYGGRGIHVSHRWLRFQAFIGDMGPRPSPSHSIERRNVNKGYGRRNCCWATATQQNRNTRKTHWITYNGETRSLPEWAERFDINPSTLSTRLQRGWSIELALTTSAADRFGKRTRQRRRIELCAAAGIATSTFEYRLSKGMSDQQALSLPKFQKRPPGPIAECAVSLGAYYERLRRGWTAEDAFHTPPRSQPTRASSAN